MEFILGTGCGQDEGRAFNPPSGLLFGPPEVPHTVTVSVFTDCFDFSNNYFFLYNFMKVSK